MGSEFGGIPREQSSQLMPHPYARVADCAQILVVPATNGQYPVTHLYPPQAVPEEHAPRELAMPDGAGQLFVETVPFVQVVKTSAVCMSLVVHVELSFIQYPQALPLQETAPQFVSSPQVPSRQVCTTPILLLLFVHRLASFLQSPQAPFLQETSEQLVFSVHALFLHSSILPMPLTLVHLVAPSVQFLKMQVSFDNV